MVSISEYTKKCKNTLGGIKKVYLMPFVKYNRFEIQTKGLNLIVFPETIVTPFECTGTYTQSSDFENGSLYFNQSLSLQLNEVYGVFDINNLLIQDYRIIVETNNNDLLIMGLYNGLKSSVNNTSGTSKNEFNGFKIDFTGKENEPMMLINDLNDLNFIIKNWYKLLTTTSKSDVFELDSFISAVNIPYKYVDTLDNSIIAQGESDGTTIPIVNLSNTFGNVDLYIDLDYAEELTELECSSLDVIYLDVSPLTSLELLWCDDNNLTSIDISNNVNLIELECEDNNLNELNVNNNTALEILYCNNTNLSSLDLSNNVNLIELQSWDNNLTELDVSNNINLEDLAILRNNITELDVSNNIYLTDLAFDDNPISEIDLSNNLDLELLGCQRTNLISLDLSNNININYLDAKENNDLTSLNIKNGNNTSTTYDIDITDVPNLTCVLVDDATYSNANWLIRDPQIVFNDVSCP